MRSTFDRRVIPERVVEFIRECQAQVPCHLAGGAALSGAHLGHRLSRDLDFFCHDPEAVRQLLQLVPVVASAIGGATRVVQDAKTFVRMEIA